MNRTKVAAFALLSGTATLVWAQGLPTQQLPNATGYGITAPATKDAPAAPTRSPAELGTGAGKPVGGYTPGSTPSDAGNKSFFESRSNTARTPGAPANAAPAGSTQKSFFESRSNTARTPGEPANAAPAGSTQKSFFESRSNTARSDPVAPATGNTTQGTAKVSRPPSLPVEPSTSAGAVTAPSKIFQ